MYRHVMINSNDDTSTTTTTTTTTTTNNNNNNNTTNKQTILTNLLWFGRGGPGPRPGSSPAPE